MSAAFCAAKRPPTPGHWIIRRSAEATMPANGGVLSGRCPRCGAALQVEADGSCAYCRALGWTG